MDITWYGHSAFRLAFADKVVLIDPFISGAGKFAGGVAEAQRGVTHVLLTHGHSDHVGDTLAICRDTGAYVVSSFEICMWLQAQGVKRINPGNPGGTVDCGGFTVSFTKAIHSSSDIDGTAVTYLGNPMGLVVKAPGEPVVYHMGDTDIFGDMALIEEIHAPKVGIVPVGDRFTMGGRIAALACRRYFHFDTIVPCHFGTFPVIDQTPDAFVSAMAEDAGKVKIAEIGKPFTV